MWAPSFPSDSLRSRKHANFAHFLRCQKNVRLQNVPLEEFQPPPYETATDLAKRAHRFISHALSHITSELEKRGEGGKEKVIKVLIVSHGGLLLQVSEVYMVFIRGLSCVWLRLPGAVNYYRSVYFHPPLCACVDISFPLLPPSCVLFICETEHALCA
jgi:hypothetical protein